MLRHVVEVTLPAGASTIEREFHAATLVNLFKAGLRAEAELVAALTGEGDARVAA